MMKTIKEMFDDIAKHYDKLNNIMTFGQHLGVKKSAISKISLKSDSKVLDICTGTGDIAIYIAKNIVKDGHVTGVDFSEKMLQLAKIKATGIENIDFVAADALSLPFEDAEFDACFISFGLRNLCNLKKGLIEMKRVTRKGGFVVNIDTGKPEGIFKFAHKLYFFYVVPIIGRLFGGDSSPYRYLPQSTEKFPSQTELVHVFEELGLRDVKKHDFLFGAISQQVGIV